MSDVHNAETRSRNMAAIRSKDTSPEIILRKELFRLGYRYRKNVQNLPGKPDIVLKKYNSCIFVNGCFWHMHENCHLANLPKTRTEFWSDKLKQNKERDLKNYAALLASGWKVILVWECAIKGKNKLEIRELFSRIKYMLNVKMHKSKILEIR